jgi:hypothetical protein
MTELVTLMTQLEHVAGFETPPSANRLRKVIAAH